MGLTVPSVYLDSCIVIYLVEEHSAYFDPVRRAMEDLPNVRFCVSPLVELECLVGPLKRGDSDLAAVFEQFFSLTVQLDMPNTVYRAAAELRATHGIRTPDALHLATALHHGCHQLWTNDDRLAKASGGMADNILHR